jgi:hypothetical protein
VRVSIELLNIANKCTFAFNLNFIYRSVPLCTGAALYAPYSLLLISNKFWMGRGEGGETEGEKQGGQVGGGE